MELPNPEQTAIEVLNRSDQISPPVDLDCIVSLWPKLRISTEELEQEGYLIDFGKQGAEIFVRKGDDLPRRRYTIAHELGHWVLQTSGFNHVDQVTKVANAAVEKWCDRFAAALLMPRDWVVGNLREAKVGGLIHAVRSAPHVYQVSHHSFRLRVSEITPISIFEVEQYGKKLDIEWSYEAQGISNDLISNTLRQSLNQLREIGDYGRHLHQSTQFLSICTRLSLGSERRRWLICILPRPNGQQRSNNQTEVIEKMQEIA